MRTSAELSIYSRGKIRRRLDGRRATPNVPHTSLQLPFAVRPTLYCRIAPPAALFAPPLNPIAILADIFFLKHGSSILRQSSNPVCGFSMIEQVRVCVVWPMENWLGSSMNHIQGWMTV